MEPLRILALAGFGLVVGVYGSLVGAGGGFLIVPLLVMFFGATPQEAVGTSLTVVFLNAISGNFSYAKQKRVDYKTGVKFALAALPGSVVGAYLSSYLVGWVFNVLFGLLLVSIALFLTLRPEGNRKTALPTADSLMRLPKGYAHRTIVDARGQVLSYTFNERGGILLSAGIGLFSSLMGIGGGVIHVPALVHLFGFPAHIAVATSLFILAISSGVGAVSHFWLGNVMYSTALSLGIGVIIGAQLGGAMSHRIHGRWLIRMLAIALLIVGLKLLMSAHF